MSFLSAVTRSIIRHECKQRYSRKFVRLLSTAAEQSATVKAEDTRHYVPRSVCHSLYILQPCYKSDYKRTIQLLSVLQTNFTLLVVLVISK